MSEVVARGEGIGTTVAQWATALLFNGLGRYEDELVAARRAGERPQELAAPNWGLTELIESAARSGAADLAADALERLSDMTRASGTDCGAQLFISPRTVEWHLRKVFTKLGVSSRRELSTALPDVVQAASPA
jgi:hypothetical protein